MFWFMTMDLAFIQYISSSTLSGNGYDFAQFTLENHARCRRLASHIPFHPVAFIHAAVSVAYQQSVGKRDTSPWSHPHSKWQKSDV